MQILIVSASVPEVSFLLNDISSAKVGELFTISFTDYTLDILITGVGMTMTAFYLGSCLQKKKYDLALNIGLAGAFDKNLQLGDVVNVTVDSFADLGAEDDMTFHSVFDLKLADTGEFPFEDGKLMADYLYRELLWYVKTVEGVTVNTVHGNDASIALFRKRCSANIETMEGAAFMYACLFHKTACIQLRSISNYVEKRDRSKWDIPLAMQALKQTVEKFLNGAT